jgi:hypothetical protein
MMQRVLQHPGKWIYGIHIKGGNGCTVEMVNTVVENITSDDFYIDFKKMAQEAYQKEYDRQKFSTTEHDFTQMSSEDYYGAMNLVKGINKHIEFIIMVANGWPNDSTLLSFDKEDIMFNAIDGARIDEMYITGANAQSAIVEFITEFAKA